MKATGIRASELRIGNLVDYEYPGYNYPQDAEWGTYTIKAKDIEEGDLEWFRPIPLTEDWLLKFGSERSHDDSLVLDFELFDVSFEFKNKECYLVDFEGTAVSMQIQFVHQLQNIYFALAGKELEMISPNP